MLNVLRHTPRYLTCAVQRRAAHYTHLPNEPFTLSPGDKPSPSEPFSVTDQELELLERLSLVDFGSEHSVKQLEEAVGFASQIVQVDTAGVEPLVSVQEDMCLELRDDTPGSTNVDDIVGNAAVFEDEFFVAPPGNRPLITHTSYRKKSQPEPSSIRNSN